MHRIMSTVTQIGGDTLLLEKSKEWCTKEKDRLVQQLDDLRLPYSSSVPSGITDEVVADAKPIQKPNKRKRKKEEDRETNALLTAKKRNDTCINNLEKHLKKNKDTPTFSLTMKQIKMLDTSLRRDLQIQHIITALTESKVPLFLEKQENGETIKRVERYCYLMRPTPINKAGFTVDRENSREVFFYVTPKVLTIFKNGVFGPDFFKSKIKELVKQYPEIAAPKTSAIASKSEEVDSSWDSD